MSRGKEGPEMRHFCDDHGAQEDEAHGEDFADRHQDASLDDFVCREQLMAPSHVAIARVEVRRPCHIFSCEPTQDYRASSGSRGLDRHRSPRVKMALDDKSIWDYPVFQGRHSARM